MRRSRPIRLSLAAEKLIALLLQGCRTSLYDFLTIKDKYCLTFRQPRISLLGVSEKRLTTVIEPPAPGPSTGVDAIEVLREVLELQRESDPKLDVDARLAFAVRNPTEEVVDSLGAVSVVCAIFGAYTPENLIPNSLLTHTNFSTLRGLKKVVEQLARTNRRNE
jgi:hypothetical protein